MLVITRRPNEAIMVEDEVEIIVLGVKGRQVRLGIRARKEIQVHRKEVYERNKENNLFPHKITEKQPEEVKTTKN